MATSSSQQAATKVIEAPASHAHSVAEVEGILGYSFHDKHLLAEALTHPTYAHRATAGGSRSVVVVPSYDRRLRAIGETALHQAVADHFRAAGHPRKTVAQLVQANTQTGQLFGAAFRHGLYSFVLRDCPDLDREVELINETLWQMKMEGDGKKGILRTPDCVGEIVMAVAGAVYLDCHRDLRLFWDAFRPFMEPIIPAEMLPMMLEISEELRTARRRGLVH